MDLDEALVDRLLRTVEAHRGDARLYLEVARPGVYRLVALAETGIGVTASKSFTRELESVLGPDRVRLRPKPLVRA